MKDNLISFLKKCNSIPGALILLVTAIIGCTLSAGPPPNFSIRVMKMGLGTGTVTSSSGINCGGTCDGTFDSAVPLTLTATPCADCVFVGWEGDVTGNSNPITVTLSANASVRAVFDLDTPIPEITDFSPEGIQSYLDSNLDVNTPAEFVKALPAEFKQNWILMTRSESLQTGTAELPRLLLPSADARYVFTIGMTIHDSYPGSDPLAIEYMQWDATDKNFRFHEVILDNIPQRGAVPPRMRHVSFDDSKCSKCHSTNNVLNRSIHPGTTGIIPGSVKFKNKPNWDVNDSWGGMLAFNRDRIYNGSIEAAAFRKIFNLWTWRNNDEARMIIEQLQLQPPGVPASDVITRTSGGAADGQINFAFDVSPPVLTEPSPVGSGATTTSNYNFNNAPGAGTATTIQNDGPFVTLRHSTDPGSTGINVAGRGVKFFDLLGGIDGTLNQQRIADELISHRFATGSFPIDVRPIALAIAKGYVRLNAARTAVVSTIPLSIDLSFFDARNGTTINGIYNDTKTRSESLTRRRADIQKINLDRIGDIYLSALEAIPTGGLIEVYGANTAAGTSTDMSRVRQEIFRRSIDLGTADVTVMGGKYVDRESYADNTEKLALFRYFLQPLGISVDKWSLGVRGRSRTFTFANAFNTYITVFDTEIRSSLDNPGDPRYKPVSGLTDANNEAQVMAAVNSTLSVLPDPGEFPKFTDVQRIFNKSCIECHGGLEYPPYANYGSFLNFSEDEELTPGGTPGASPRLARSHAIATLRATGLGSPLYARIVMTSENCPSGLMPCGGPSLSKTDIETIRRWIVGGNPYTNGDPHIRTVDNVRYDFQAAGEFVLLRDENLELQARHTPVETNAPLGPNAHTGLTSCVSLNTAVAIRIGKHRITYQPDASGKPDPSGLQLRINGKLVERIANGVSLGIDGRVMPTVAPGGLQVEAPGGTVIVITPGWWDHYKVWYLNIDTRQVRATEGLMGAIAPKSWLPALPDGTSVGPLPRDLNQRYHDLYQKFGNAWRVNDSTSLFDYAPGTTTKSFFLDSWPGGTQSCDVPGQEGPAPLTVMTLETATALATGITDPDRKEDCIKDLMITGDSTFVKAYRLADKIIRNKLPDSPILLYPQDFDTVSAAVDFGWKNATDADGDIPNYKLYVWPVDDTPDINNAMIISSSGGLSITLLLLILFIVIILLAVIWRVNLSGKIKWLATVVVLVVCVIVTGYFWSRKKGDELSGNFEGLALGKAYFWKVIVEDGKGGVSESETRRISIQ